MIYRFEREARRPKTIATVAGIWMIVIALWIWLDLAMFICIGILAFTIPALLEIWRNTVASIEVWPNRIVWTSSLTRGDRSDIDHVRFNRRFDGSMKITLVHVGGKPTRLPPDVNPPTQDIETALKTAGIAVQRHPFSLLG